MIGQRLGDLSNNCTSQIYRQVIAQLAHYGGRRGNHHLFKGAVSMGFAQDTRHLLRKTILGDLVLIGRLNRRPPSNGAGIGPIRAAAALFVIGWIVHRPVPDDPQIVVFRIAVVSQEQGLAAI